MEKLTAKLFYWLGTAGLILLVLTFLLYVFDWIPPALSATLSAEHWDEPMQEDWDMPENWQDGEVLSRAALAFLIAIPLPILLFIAAIWFREKNAIYACITLGIVIVLIVAATSSP
ncbi:MAG: hypothetical protein B0D92_03055 [Spirochaeta sp. LUC14_002_19_P3]|nr:MAG: hypothetical protein B0D92_03055 [Spirochaeta sp. LUC14_002_19_P3]